MNEYLAECLNLFVRKQNQNLSYKIIDRKKHEIEKFLTFIEGRGITDLADFDIFNSMAEEGISG